ncbi:MAG: PASTA domain-containing protein [Gammaproteobacteria bacterium]|nr:PASTA domain-containing protein [Gammaproteobacteria bacterium]
MSTKDISRYLFQPEKRYVGARMQMGRVITDDDLNVHRRLHAEDARRTLAETVCAKGTPNDGFRIIDVRVAGDQGSYDFAISPGSFYLGGLRFEIAEQERLRDQTDWLQVDAEDTVLPALPASEDTHLVYLRAWEQCVSAVEDSEILEHALGGPDTSVLVRRMRRVEVFELPEEFAGECTEAFEALTQALTAQGEAAALDSEYCELRSLARLTVGFDGVTATDPCQPQVNQGFIGAENHAIRVQLTEPNRFVWGYDNASPIYRVQALEADGELREIQLLTPPRDQLSQPTTDHVVEILRWGALLPNGEKVAEQRLRSHFTRVDTSFDPESNRLTIVDAVPEDWRTWANDHPEYRSDRDATDDASYFYMRVWTGQPPQGAGGPFDHQFDPGGDPVALAGTGLTLAFSDPGLPGDYWIIAARPNTPDRVVPWDLLDAAPPAGPRQFFAPLALIQWARADDQSLSATVRDCRPRFHPVCATTDCCTYTVGDGIRTHGVFNSLQQAIDHLPEEGGEICLLPGLHRANAEIRGRRDIRVKGCDIQTRVVPLPGQSQTPVLTIVDSTGIRVEHLDVVSFGGTGFALEQTDGGTLADIRIAHNHIVSCVHAIQVNGGSRIHIYWNRIRVLDLEEGRESVVILAEDSLIERNDIGVRPAPPEPPGGPPPPAERDPTDPCAEPELLFANPFLLNSVLFQVFFALPHLQALLANIVQPYRALGGIRIAGRSERIKVAENQIVGGAGNGVTLGGSPPGAVDDEEPEDTQPVPPLVNGGTEVFATVTEAGSAVSGVAVRLLRTTGQATSVADTTNANGQVLLRLEPGEYRAVSLSPGHRIVAINRNVSDELGESFELVTERDDRRPPRDFGFIYDTVIEANTIQAMGLSGIGSPLTATALAPFFGLGQASVAAGALRQRVLPTGNPIIGAEIYRNRISACLRTPFGDELRALTQTRGLGGISLGPASAVGIAENTIEGNGVNHLDPVCGIFVVGDQLEIHRNQVIDNGVIDGSLELAPRPGVRGGIVTRAALRLFPAAGQLGFGRDYAARIHDNLVRQPLGQALVVDGVGPISIDANRFHSLRSAPGPLGITAATVWIGNSGDDAQLASGTTTFNGNQVLGGPEARSGTNVYINTRGDLGFEANQIDALNAGQEISGSNNISLGSLINARLVGNTLRASDSRFKEPDASVDPVLGVTDHLISLASQATTMNNTVSNQGDHCILAVSAQGPAHVTEALNQVLDDRLCSRVDPAIRPVITSNAMNRIGRTTLLGREVFVGAAPATPLDSDQQLLQASYSTLFAQLQALEIQQAAAWVESTAVARALVQQEMVRLASRQRDQDARPAAFQSHLAEGLDAAQAFSVNAELAGVTVAQVEEGGMRIHGRVVDAANRGIDSILLCLVNADGNSVEDTQPVQTEASGYYAFVLDAPTVSKLARRHPEGVHLSLFTRRGTPIHTTRDTVPIAPDGREVVNIALDRTRDLAVIEPGKPGPAPEPEPITVIVPELTGIVEAEAIQRLQAALLTVGDRRVRVAPDQVGLVLQQTPEAGADVRPNTPVHITVGTQRLARVPSLTERTLREAEAMLTESSLRSGTLEPTGASGDSIVVSQQPDAGAEVESGSAVDMQLRLPEQPQFVTVPRVVDAMLDGARGTLSEAQLTVGEITRRADPNRVGRVMEQIPAAGEDVPVGSQVDLVVGSEPRRSEPAVIRAIIGRMASHAEFESIGATPEKLIRLSLANEIRTREQLAQLLEMEDRDIRSLFRLRRNAQGAAFKRILKNALE